MKKTGVEEEQELIFSTDEENEDKKTSGNVTGNDNKYCPKMNIE
jgi:hypothetical protein